MGLLRSAAVAVFVLALAACASSQSHRVATLDDTGDGFRLAVSADAASGLLGGLMNGELDCSSRTDGTLGAVLTALDRGGPRARASARDGDGSLTGRRRGNRVTLVAGAGEGRLEVTMPWAAAECLLGRPTDLAKALDGLEVDLVDDTGHRTSLRLD